MLSEDPGSSSHFLQLVRGYCWPWKKTASVFVVQLWFDWCVFTTVTKIRKPKVWWPGNEIHVKKQVIGIIQQQNRYIKSTSNLEGLKDFKKHTCFWVAVLLAPRGLRREICSTCSWDQVCSHHCGFAGRVFNLDFFGKERLHTSHFVSWKKSPFGRKTPGFSQKPPRVWGKKLGCLLIFPPMELMFNWFMFCTMKNPESTQQQNNLPEKRPLNSSYWVFPWVFSYLGNSPFLFSLGHPMNPHPTLVAFIIIQRKVNVFETQSTLQRWELQVRPLEMVQRCREFNESFGACHTRIFIGG